MTNKIKTLFAVTRTRGKAWENDKPMHLQTGWAEHAEYMNKLTADGFIVLGGPLGNSEDILLIIDAAGEKEIIKKLGFDNWSMMYILKIKDIIPWTILLQPEKK